MNAWHIIHVRVQIAQSKCNVRVDICDTRLQKYTKASHRHRVFLIECYTSNVCKQHFRYRQNELWTKEHNLDERWWWIRSKKLRTCNQRSFKSRKTEKWIARTHISKVNHHKKKKKSIFKYKTKKFHINSSYHQKNH